MRRPAESRGKPAHYAVGFTTMAAVLGGLTLILVLVVLPRRYVLHAGLRESGVTFPTAAPAFAPPEEQPRAAVPRPTVVAPPPPGPAELFWDAVLPLLEEARYEAALPVFEAYLERHPDDRAIRREHAITLDRAGHRERAASVYAELLAQRNERDLRLLYARSLRDQGRVDEAQVQYAVLLDAEPEDVNVALEAARALAWDRRYDGAADILRSIVERHPDDAVARVELARVLYWSGQLDEADRVLAALTDEDRRRLGAEELAQDLRAALVTEEDETGIEPAPPSTAEAAASMLAGGDVAGAAALYGRAVEEQPRDTALLRTYADVLQYRLEDLSGARSALLRLRESRGDDPALAFRIAQLDVWTGRNGDAMDRLERLLGVQDSGSERTLPPAREAEARALLGDLYRWEGLRVLSADAYGQALDADPQSQGARLGLAELEREVDRQLADVERPRVGTDVYSFSDSDDFTRLDLGLEAVTVVGSWVYGGRAGSRVVRGNGIDGLSGSERGLFAEVELGRWWRWGTVRTGLRLGMERVRPAGTDAIFGASLRWESLASFRTDLRYEHGPAYPLTVTLSSLLLPVRQDRWTLSAARQLGRRWSLSLSGDAARLSAADAAAWPEGSSVRVEGGVSVGRAVTDHLLFGVNVRALSYSEAAPASNGRPLFWDPRAVYALGTYAQLNLPTGSWELHGRVGPALAWIDERAVEGFDRVPHFSAEGGVSHRGSKVRTSLDLFYYQGRFDGYKGYGARLGLAVVDPFLRSPR